MAKTRSISSINAEIHQTQEELAKLRQKQVSLEDILINLQKTKGEDNEQRESL